MPGDYLELFWTLLGVRNLEQLKRSIPDDFDWSVLHPINKTTILVEALNLQHQGEDNLNLIEWLVEERCKFFAKVWSALVATNLDSVGSRGSKESTKISVNCENLSFLSYISAWRTEFKGKDEWKQQACSSLTKWWTELQKASSQPQSMRPRAPVDLGIIENWENYLASAASHDLTIEAADGLRDSSRSDAQTGISSGPGHAGIAHERMSVPANPAERHQQQCSQIGIGNALHMFLAK